MKTPHRFLITAALLSAAACATTPQPPTEALRAAETAIANAEKGRAAEHAAPELAEARDKLAGARTAVQQENMMLALHLAEQSRVNAELASARSEAIKAGAVNDEMRQSTEAMKQEMQRNPGAR